MLRLSTGAIQICDRTALGARLRTALGDAPTVGEVSLVLGSEQTTPEQWMRARTWVAVLPTDLTELWIGPCQVLAASYGELRRDGLLRRRPVEAGWAKSPIGAEELQSMPPKQAAEMIADWRPVPSDWPGGARELARTLETLVKDDPEGWFSEPVTVATKLYHPMYIGDYLQAASGVATNTDLPVAGLLDVIQLVRAEPWPVVPLGREQLDYDPDWNEAQRSAVSLIEELARADTDFGERVDEAWDIIEAAARNTSEPSLGSDDTDQFTRAFNRSSTRAFETAILFVAAELRASRPVRPAFEDLLEFSLRLDGSDGEEYRAILAPRIGWLRHVLPEWAADNVETLFGSEAPDGLAQLTIDVALEIGPPTGWILETCPKMVQDAVARQVERAMRHLLIAMLWECRGYQVHSVVGFLESHPALVSDAGTQLSALVGDDEIDQRYIDIAVTLWEALLESNAASSLEGFGWMSTATALDTDRWAELTLATLGKTGGRISWKDQVADRAMSQPVTGTKLALLDQLIRGQREHWSLRHIADQIGDYLASAANLEATDEFRRLRTTLIERGMIDT